MAERQDGRPTGPPTLEDVERLTPESDFSAFTAPGVDPQVRNAALRKLFSSDPRLGRPDGLDVQVDEVVEVEGSARGRQHKILLARQLGLLDDELLDQLPPGEVPPQAP